ncbi:hypothetical protein FPV67DRAFT_1670329 [Lyophyllum atratum]|nr:hypothetical protein FPV67DRAFT_1670329 [Lyophyllum atratum]
MSESAKYPASTQAARRQASSNYYYWLAGRELESQLQNIVQRNTPSWEDEAGNSAHVPPRLRHTAQTKSLKAAREQATRAKYDQFMKSHYVLDYTLGERSLTNFEVAAEMWNIAHHLLHEEAKQNDGKNRGLGKFFNDVNRDWFQQWMELDACIAAGKIPEGVIRADDSNLWSDELEKIWKDAVITRQKQLRSWFRNSEKRVTGTQGTTRRKSTGQMLSLLKGLWTRLHKAEEMYQIKYKEKVNLLINEALGRTGGEGSKGKGCGDVEGEGEYDDDGEGKGEGEGEGEDEDEGEGDGEGEVMGGRKSCALLFLTTRREVVRKAWLAETEKVKEVVRLALEEEKNQKAAMLEGKKEGLERTPEQRKFAIAHQITLMEAVCGPDPSQKEKIRLQTVSYGTNQDNKSYTIKYKADKLAFDESYTGWLREVYPKHGIHGHRGLSGSQSNERIADPSNLLIAFDKNDEESSTLNRTSSTPDCTSTADIPGPISKPSDVSSTSNTGSATSTPLTPKHNSTAGIAEPISDPFASQADVDATTATSGSLSGGADQWSVFDHDFTLDLDQIGDPEATSTTSIPVPSETLGNPSPITPITTQSTHAQGVAPPVIPFSTVDGFSFSNKLFLDSLSDYETITEQLNRAHLAHSMTTLQPLVPLPPPIPMYQSSTMLPVPMNVFGTHPPPLPNLAPTSEFHNFFLPDQSVQAPPFSFHMDTSMSNHHQMASTLLHPIFAGLSIPSAPALALPDPAPSSVQLTELDALEQAAIGPVDCGDTGFFITRPALPVTKAGVEIGSGRGCGDGRGHGAGCGCGGGGGGGGGGRGGKKNIGTDRVSSSPASAGPDQVQPPSRRPDHHIDAANNVANATANAPKTTSPNPAEEDLIDTVGLPLRAKRVIKLARDLDGIARPLPGEAAAARAAAGTSKRKAAGSANASSKKK